MFGVGTQELLVILLVALLLFGGKRIPEIARSLGKSMGDFRRAIHEVQREVDLEMLKDSVSEDDRRRPSGDPPRRPPRRNAPPSGPGGSPAGGNALPSGRGDQPAGKEGPRSGPGGKPAGEDGGRSGGNDRRPGGAADACEAGSRRGDARGAANER